MKLKFSPSDHCLVHSSHDEAEQTIACLSQLVSSKSGIVHRLNKSVSAPDLPRYFHFEATMADPRRWIPNYRGKTDSWDALNRTRSFGSAICEHLALAKVTGESIERFCLYFYTDDDVQYGSYDELSAYAIDPRRFALPSSQELPLPQAAGNSQMLLSPFSPSVQTGWVKALSLKTCQQRLVPACFAFVSYQFNSPAEAITYPISTGAACARSPKRAIIRGILEVIERDAFMITWMNRISAPQVISMEDARYPELTESLKRFGKANADLRVYLLPTDVDAYVALAVSVHKEGKRPALSTGLSASLDPGHAITKAIEECAFVMHYATRLRRFLSPEEVQALPGGSYYTLDSLKRADFLLESDNVVSLPSLPSYSADTEDLELQHCLSSLESKSLETLVVDLGFPALEELGFYVYKTIIPGMQPLGLAHFWFLTGNRIYSVPQALGYTESLSVQGMPLNLEPHPWA